LAPRGVAQATALGRMLGRSGTVPDRALVSPAVRAVETWRRVAPAANWNSVPVFLEERAYPGAPDAVRACLASLPETVRTVVVVGHNPGLELLAEAWSGRPVRIPTSMALAFAVEDVGGPRRERAELLETWDPREAGAPAAEGPMVP